jgi:hypothetical protein
MDRLWLVGVLENGVVSRGGLFTAVSRGTDGAWLSRMGRGGVYLGALADSIDPLGPLFL